MTEETVVTVVTEETLVTEKIVVTENRDSSDSETAYERVPVWRTEGKYEVFGPMKR